MSVEIGITGVSVLFIYGTFCAAVSVPYALVTFYAALDMATRSRLMETTGLNKPAAKKAMGNRASLYFVLIAGMWIGIGTAYWYLQNAIHGYGVLTWGWEILYAGLYAGSATFFGSVAALRFDTNSEKNKLIVKPKNLQ
jgi:hypothetical protein